MITLEETRVGVILICAMPLIVVRYREELEVLVVRRSERHHSERLFIIPRWYVGVR